MLHLHVQLRGVHFDDVDHGNDIHVADPDLPRETGPIGLRARDTEQVPSRVARFSRGVRDKPEKRTNSASCAEMEIFGTYSNITYSALNLPSISCDDGECKMDVPIKAGISQHPFDFSHFVLVLCVTV